MAGLDNKLKPTSVILTDRGYMSVAEAEYQHSLGNLNIIGRDGRAVNSQDLVQQEGDTTLQGFEPTAQEIIESNLEPLIGLPALEAGDIYKQMGGFGSTLDNRTGIQSSQQMFDETYQEALANEALANVLETQGVPDVVSSEDYFAQMGDTLRSLGIDPEQFTSVASGVDTGLENQLAQPDDLDFLGEGDDTIVTDDQTGKQDEEDRQAQWDGLDKDADFGTLLDQALRIFGAYSPEAIFNVVKVVNDRGISVGEVATATGNTVESINQAAAESGTAIKNQDLGNDDQAVEDTVADETTTGGNNNEVVLVDDSTATDVPDGEPTVVMDRPADRTVVMDTPVTPEPTLTSFMPDLPKQQQTNITLLQNIMNETPITESILFPTEFTKLENVQQGMFEQFLSAAGGNQ